MTARAENQAEDTVTRLVQDRAELLTALEGMLAWARRVKGRTPGPEIAQACAAIAKATRP